MTAHATAGRGSSVSLDAGTRFLRLGLGLTALLAAGCGDNSTAPVEAGSVSLTVVSGNAQSAVVGTTLQQPLVVKATDDGGRTLAGIGVRFRVTSGGGSVRVGAATTDSKGLATDRWTLGTSTAQTQTLEVRAVSSSGQELGLGSFTATALAGPAARVAMVTGNGQSLFRGTVVPAAPAIRAFDQYDNPVPNQQVIFAVGSGGGGLAGASAVTDAMGVARAGAWTVGPVSGQNMLIATVVGNGIAGNPVTFTATAKDWATRAPMPTARAQASAGAVNGVLYVMGGFDGARAIGAVEAYDPTTNSWTTRAPMLTARSGLGLGVVNGVLYAVGGVNESGLVGTVEAYDPATNTWTARAPMPTARAGLGVGVVNGILYAVGGWTTYGASVLGTVEAYDPAMNSWTTKAEMPHHRAGFGIGVVNGVLYAVGGASDAGGDWYVLPAIEAYDPGTNTWSLKAPMPTARSGLGVGVFNGVLYVVGGNRVAEDALGAVEVYNPVANSWSVGDPMIAATAGSGVGVVNGVLYAVGGSGGERTAQAFYIP